MSRARANGRASSVMHRGGVLTLVTFVPLASAGAPSAVLDEVIVTAQRIARPAQSVPASISTLSADELIERDLVTARDLATAIPNLSWAGADADGLAGIFLRGIGSQTGHPNQLGAVGLYSDDVTLNAPLLTNLALLDLERVEVVRGPWNAGFGRNASGGAVRFFSRAPVVGAGALADVMLRVGTSGRFDGELASGFPLGERSAARIAFAAESLGDYIHNATLARDEGGHERVTARARWRHEAQTMVDVSLHGSRIEGGSVRYKQIGRGTPESPGRSDCPFLARNPNPGNGCVDQTGFADTSAFDENFSGTASRFSASMAGAALRIEHAFGAARLVSITAFEGGDSRRSTDGDGGPSYLYVAFQETDSNQWSQDVALASRDDVGSGWHVGMHLFGEDARYTSVRRHPNAALTPALVPGVPIPATDLRTSIVYGDLDQHLRHASVWAQADHALSAMSTLTGEIRVAYERLGADKLSGAWADTTPEIAPEEYLGLADVHAFTATSVEVGAGALPQLCPGPFDLTRCYTRSHVERDDVLWGGRLTLDRRFVNVLGYASIARGFKGAGMSPIAREAILGRSSRAMNPERVITYELGAKSEWRSHTLRINASVFFNDWADYQTLLSAPTPPSGTVGLLANLPQARTWGAELEVDWAPSAHWLARAGLGFTHSEVRDAGEFVGAAPGSPLPAVPELTFNGLLARTWTMGSDRLTAQVEAAYSDARSFSLDPDPARTEPHYWLIDASVRYRLGAAERLEARLWGRNLSGTRYCAKRHLVGGLGVGDTYACEPNEGIRFFGVSVFARID